MSSIPTMAIPLFIFHWKNLRNFRKTYGKFRRKRKTTEIQLYLCGPQTGNIFRSMDSLVLRHPIICTEFNVRSFISVIQQFLLLQFSRKPCHSNYFCLSSPESYAIPVIPASVFQKAVPQQLFQPQFQKAVPQQLILPQFSRRRAMAVIPALVLQKNLPQDLKGQQREMVFWLNLSHIEQLERIFKKFKFIIINEDIHTFMSLGVLGEYAKSLFASYPCTHKSFPRILRIHLNTFRAYGDDFVYRK